MPWNSKRKSYMCTTKYQHENTYLHKYLLVVLLLNKSLLWIMQHCEKLQIVCVLMTPTLIHSFEIWELLSPYIDMPLSHILKKGDKEERTVKWKHRSSSSL